VSPRIRIDKPPVTAFCKRNHVRRLAFFGSVLRDDFGPESDVDVLVEFEPGHVPGFAFFDLQEELAAILGRRVDLHAKGSLSRYFRDEGDREAQDQYVAA
jgi:predicted nucleotidyltransferase